MGVSKNRGTQQPWVFLLKMIILGVFWGVPLFSETSTWTLSVWLQYDSLEDIHGLLDKYHCDSNGCSSFKKGHPRKKTSFFSVQKFGIANKQPGESHKHYILGSSHNDPHQLYKISLIRCHLFPIHFPQSPATEISSPSPGTRTETTTTGITSSAMTFWRNGLWSGQGWPAAMALDIQGHRN